MAFAFNTAGEQQISLFDFYNSLTERTDWQRCCQAKSRAQNEDACRLRHVD